MIFFSNVALDLLYSILSKSPIFLPTWVTFSSITSLFMGIFLLIQVGISPLQRHEENDSLHTSVSMVLLKFSLQIGIHEIEVNYFCNYHLYIFFLLNDWPIHCTQKIYNTQKNHTYSSRESPRIQENNAHTQKFAITMMHLPKPQN